MRNTMRHLSPRRCKNTLASGLDARVFLDLVHHSIKLAKWLIESPLGNGRGQMPKASGEGLLVNAKVSTKEKGGVRCDKVTSDKRTLIERG